MLITITKTKTMSKKFIVKNFFDGCLLKKNDYEVLATKHQDEPHCMYKDLWLFETKEEAERFILEHAIKQVTIVEVYI